MTPPAHIRLAEADDPRAEGWQLDLPQDPAAAAEYLRGIERARELELQAIRRLRARIEGSTTRRRFQPSRRLMAAVVAFVLAAATITLWTTLGSDATTARSSPGRAAGHAGHAPAGSGLAVALQDDGPVASRTTLEAGTTTLILRNELDSDTSLQLDAPGDGTPMTSQTIGPGERIEWEVTLDAGTYELCVVVDGELRMGSTLTVR